MLIRYLWQLKTVVFLQWCLICAVLLEDLSDASFLGKHLVLLANVRLDWEVIARYKPGDTKGGSIIVPLTSSLTGLELAV